MKSKIMKPSELKTLMTRLKEHYVFYNEAMAIMKKRYKYGSARTTLSELTKTGKVEKYEIHNIPTLYNKKDLLEAIKEQHG